MSITKVDGSMFKNVPTIFGYACSDETSDLATGQVTSFPMPHAMTLDEVRADLTTAATGSTFIVDIKENGVTILSTLISIDAGETSSETALTPAVISDTSLAKNSIMTVHVTQFGATIAGAGLKIFFTGKIV